MRTIRIKLYKFDELSKEAQQNAISSLSDINVDQYWSKFMLEYMSETLSTLGFINSNIMFSGFSSQGDGACFTCDYIDFKLYKDGKYKDFSNVISCSITHSYRCYFSTSTTVNLDVQIDMSEDKFTQIEKDIENERERIGNELYRQLEKEYDYLTSEKSIIETIEANEYEFTKDGKLN